MKDKIENIKKAWYLVREARNLMSKEAMPVATVLDNIMTELQADLKNMVFKQWCKNEGDFFSRDEFKVILERWSYNDKN